MQPKLEISLREDFTRIASTGYVPTYPRKRNAPPAGAPSCFLLARGISPCPPVKEKNIDAVSRLIRKNASSNAQSALAERAKYEQ